MPTPSLLLSAIVLSGIAIASTTAVEFSAQDAPPAAEAPATTKANPVKPTPESQAHAKKQYGYDCEMCHGATGDGKTDLAKDMKLALTDLTNPKTLEGKTDGEIFDLIKNGKGQMTGEGSRMKDEDAWNLVIYVRSLAKK